MEAIALLSTPGTHTGARAVEEGSPAALFFARRRRVIALRRNSERLHVDGGLTTERSVSLTARENAELLLVEVGPAAEIIRKRHARENAMKALLVYPEHLPQACWTLSPRSRRGRLSQNEAPEDAGGYSRYRR